MQIAWQHCVRWVQKQNTHTTCVKHADKWSVKCYCLFIDCLSMRWAIIFTSLGSPRFPVVSVFLFVIHLCKQWKAEHITMKAITGLLLWTLIMVLFPRPLSNLRAACRVAEGGTLPSSLQPEHKGTGRACRPHESLLPGSNIFLMSSQGVGIETGFTTVHPGLPRGGSNLSTSKAGAAFMYASGGCWRVVFRVWHLFFASCAEARGSRRGWVRLHTSEIAPQLQRQPEALKK